MENCADSGQYLGWIQQMQDTFAALAYVSGSIRFISLVSSALFQFVPLPLCPSEGWYQVKCNQHGRRKKVSILIFSWHFKLWPCSIAIVLALVLYTYLYVFCLFYLCFVTHQRGLGRERSGHPHAQMFTELHCFWPSSDGALKLWSTGALKLENCRASGWTKTERNQTKRSEPRWNVGNSTYELNWPFVQLLCLSELAYFGMTMRCAMLVARTQKHSFAKKGFPSTQDPVPSTRRSGHHILAHYVYAACVLYVCSLRPRYLAHPPWSVCESPWQKVNSLRLRLWLLLRLLLLLVLVLFI